MDVSIIFKIAGVGIITAIVNQVLKKSDKEEIATLATLAGLIIEVIGKNALWTRAWKPEVRAIPVS